MSTAVPQPQPVPQPAPQTQAPHQQAVRFAEEPIPELRIYSHSNLLYWWPVWVVGYLMAFLTWIDGQYVDFGDHSELVAKEKWLGVVFTVVLFLVILMTNVTLRGVASAMAILAVLFIAVLFAYLGWWESIVRRCRTCRST